MRRNVQNADKTHPSPNFSKTAREWILSSALYDGIEDEDIRQIQTLLAEKGANPNVLLPEYGITPFHLVVANENVHFAVRATDVCLQHGADPNVRSEDGLTPVLLAAMWGCTEVLHVLLASGGNPWLVDCYNKNAFDYAMIEGQHECYEVLRSFCNSQPKPANQLKSPYQLNLKRVVVYKNDLQIIYDASPSNSTSKRCASTQTSPPLLKSGKKQMAPRDLSENCNTLSNNKSMSFNNKCEYNLKYQNQEHSERNGQVHQMGLNNMNGHDDSVMSTKLQDLIVKHRRNMSIFEHSPVSTDNDSMSSGVVSWKDFNGSTEVPGVVSELVDRLERTNKIRQSLKSNACDNMFKNITCRKKSSRSGSDSPDLNISESENNELAKNDIGFICSSSISELSYESLRDSSQNRNSGGFVLSSISNAGDDSTIAMQKVGSPPSIGFILDNLNETGHATRNSSLFSDIGSDVVCNAPGENVEGHDFLMTEDDSSQEKALFVTKLSSSGSPVPYVSCEDENTRERDSDEVFESCVENIEKVYEPQTESEPSVREESDVGGINLLMDSILNVVDSREVRTPINKKIVTSTPDKNSSESEEASFVTATDKNSEFSKTAAKEAKIVATDEEDPYISISEEYEYADLEEGVVLLERHYLVDDHSKFSNDLDKPVTKRGISSGTTEESEVSTISGSERAYDTDDLRRTLQEHGFIPGPINGNTKRLYLRKLKRFRKKPQPTLSLGQPAYSPELLKTLGASCEHLLFDWAHLEESMSASFTCTRNRPWRQGSSKTSFTYLLLDPRVAHNLSACATNTPYFQQWPNFLQAIFYIGKGKRSRPYNHLYDAVAIWNRKEDNYSSSKKIQRILDIWKSGVGVICLHVFFNIIPVEAFTREAAMISALTLSHLTNEKTGEFYGSASCWNSRQRCRLGCVLLHRAFRVFLAEGERQLRPADID